MKKGILQILKEMVIKAIAEEFCDIEVYGERVPQKGENRCFGVSIQSVEQKPLLGGRREQWISINVEYREGVEKRAKAESVEKAEMLYDVLSMVGEQGNEFLAKKMQHRMTEKGFCFEVVYYVQIKPIADERKMERLEHNGKKVVGY